MKRENIIYVPYKTLEDIAVSIVSRQDKRLKEARVRHCVIEGRSGPVYIIDKEHKDIFLVFCKDYTKKVVRELFPDRKDPVVELSLAEFLKERQAQEVADCIKHFENEE